MNAITKITMEFEDDLRNYLQVPWQLEKEYAELRSVDKSRFSIFASLTILQYCLMKFVSETNFHDNAMLMVIAQTTQMCAMMCPNGLPILHGMQQYFEDYMTAVRQRGGALTVPRSLELPDVGAFFASMVKTAYPFIECFTKNFIRNESDNLAEFMTYFIKKAEAHYVAYKPLLLEYHRDCGC